jgi:hypothetical protein
MGIWRRATCGKGTSQNHTIACMLYTFETIARLISFAIFVKLNTKNIAFIVTWYHQLNFFKKNRLAVMCYFVFWQYYCFAVAQKLASVMGKTIFGLTKKNIEASGKRLIMEITICFLGCRLAEDVSYCLVHKKWHILLKRRATQPR